MPAAKSALPPGDFGEVVATPFMENVPDNLRRATSRLQFTPSYVVVGVYRLCTDSKLYVPAWQKCKHGFRRGLTVGLVWAATTFNIQRKFVKLFLMKSPRVTGLSREGIFGIQLPFDLPTYATVFFLSTQLTVIITFLPSRNIRIARERAYDQTMNLGEGPDFWRPYVEEWDRQLRKGIYKIRVASFDFVPIVGIMTQHGQSTRYCRYLHKPYFKAKAMTPTQLGSLLRSENGTTERLPIIGLVFSVSNRVGAAMWAHDLEKRQHYIAEQKAGKGKK
ncbi:hypothetical protein A0H81_11493 [Grifola frondosa]|uniref:Uncharacterized protein n=1 Tax=Grifola frondosa TaxID=5627 RepID=A0A1C7LX32_GRIFR|nr:hypothetical protein A0H81_11493 [Grifola frondosa]